MKSKYWATAVVLLVAGVLFASTNYNQGAGSSGGPGHANPATPATWTQLQARIKKMLTAKPKSDVHGAAFAGTEAPGSPKYFYTTKTQAEIAVGHTKTQDQKDLLRADFSVPGPIINVDWMCTGPGDSCQHTYGCDAACTAYTHPWQINGNQGTWWGKTDDGNENLYTFAVHYRAQ